MKYQRPDTTLNKNNKMRNAQSQNKINAVFFLGKKKELEKDCRRLLSLNF